MYNVVVDFKEFINDKYVVWRGKGRASISEFARYIGVSQQVLNRWINDGYTPSARYLPKLAEKFPDVYEVLGLPTPGLSEFNSLPVDVQHAILEAWSAAEARMAKKGTTLKSPGR